MTGKQLILIASLGACAIGTCYYYLSESVIETRDKLAGKVEQQYNQDAQAYTKEDIMEKKIPAKNQK